jgi:hypothetical protein
MIAPLAPKNLSFSLTPFSIMNDNMTNPRSWCLFLCFEVVGFLAFRVSRHHRSSHSPCETKNIESRTKNVLLTFFVLLAMFFVSHGESMAATSYRGHPGAQHIATYTKRDIYNISRLL